MIPKILISIALFPIIYLAIAGGLILSQNPSPLPANQESLDFSEVRKNDLSNLPEPITIKMRDGYKLPVRFYGAKDNGPLLVLIHGSGWHGMQFNTLANSLANNAHIAVPDLRGHGENPLRRGDVDYIGQFEDDLADLIEQTVEENQKVVIAGHSSGGGLVVRLAGSAYADKMDAAILLAPFLKYNAPTMRPNSGGWAHTLTRRIIGISMLNAVSITALNDMEIIQFSMPKAALDGPLGHTTTTSYTYRLNTSYAPRTNYLEEVAKLPKFLLVAGSDDEAFIASEYEPLLSSVTDKGSYQIVEGVGHLDIVDQDATANLMREFLTNLQ